MIVPSRFVEELPEKFVEKNIYSEENENQDQDFEFNQDFEIEEETRESWLAQVSKRIK